MSLSEERAKELAHEMVIDFGKNLKTNPEMWVKDLFAKHLMIAAKESAEQQVRKDADLMASVNAHYSTRQGDYRAETLILAQLPTPPESKSEGR
jgi:hypothetical protein